jgi:sodium/hydrogen antiporter
MDINLVLSVFAAVILILSAFSSFLQRISLPGPLTGVAAGVLLGPFGSGMLRLEDFALPPGILLEQASRLTLAVGLAGVALRLPHGYWRANLRWTVPVIVVGMGVMFTVASGMLWALLGLPLLTALLLGAIITPTDPVVTTPVVTGSLARKNIPDRVRYNLSAESGLNDGLGYLFVSLPVLLLISPPRQAWGELLTRVFLWEVLGAVAAGGAAGYVLARLFLVAKDRGFMEKTSYLGFIIPLSLAVLGLAKLMGTDGILAVFIAAAVFGQQIPQADKAQQGQIDDVINRFFLLPVFILLGIGLPWKEWAELGPAVPLVLAAALILRRAAAVWLIRPAIKTLHSRSETAFMGWFGAVGVSALYYATLAERLAGRHDIFAYIALAITLSVLIHGLTSAPFSRWLHLSGMRAPVAN